MKARHLAKNEIEKDLKEKQKNRIILMISKSSPPKKPP